MNSSHLHLLFNHVPILGTLFGLILLVFGIFKKNNTLQYAGLITLIITGIISYPAHETGEGAEDLVEHIQGVSHHYIHEHEEIAHTGFLLSSILGLLSLIGFVLLRKNKNTKFLIPAIAVFALIVFGVFAKVGTTGGEIMHPEIRKDFKPSVHEEEEHEHEEEHKE